MPFRPTFSSIRPGIRQNLLAGFLLLLLGWAANAQAADLQYVVWLDTHASGTGCSATPDPDGAALAGLDYRITARVSGDETAGFQVASVTLDRCQGSGFATQQTTAPDTPVGRGLGLNGADVIELGGFDLGLLGNPQTIRTATAAYQLTDTGQDYIGSLPAAGTATADYTLNAVGITEDIAPIPTLGQYALLLLALLVAIIAYKARKSPYALGSIAALVAVLGGMGASYEVRAGFARIVVDGFVSDWVGMSPVESRVAVVGGDATNLFLAHDDAALYVRLDVKTLEDPDQEVEKPSLAGRVALPLEGANVEFFDADGNSITKKEQVTDTEGVFKVELEDPSIVVTAIATGGRHNGQEFSGGILSPCTESSCVISPYRHALWLLGQEYSEDGITKATSLLNSTLALDQDPFSVDQDIPSFDRAAFSALVADGGYYNLVLSLAADVRDGLVDDQRFVTPFPLAKQRALQTETFEIDQSNVQSIQTIDEQGNVTTTPRKLILTSISSGNTSTGDSVDTYGYMDDIVLLEEDNDGNQTVVFESFQVGGWRGRLNTQTTILSKIFSRDAVLRMLPELEKDRIASRLLDQYADTFEEAERLWLRVVNVDVLNVALFDPLVKRLINHARSFTKNNEYAETDLDSALRTLQPLNGTAMRMRSPTNKAQHDMGWVSMAYDGNNGFAVKNSMPLYLSLVSGGYSFSDFTSGLSGMDALVSPITGPNVADPYGEGALALAVSKILNTSKSTSMVGTTFDASLFGPNNVMLSGFPDKAAYCETGEGRYVVSKKLGWNAHTLANTLDLISAASPGLGKVAPSFIEKVQDIGNGIDEIVEALNDGLVLGDGMLLGLDALAAIDAISAENQHDIRTQIIDPMRNTIGNLRTIVEKLPDIGGTSSTPALDLLTDKPLTSKSGIVGSMLSSKDGRTALGGGFILSAFAPEKRPNLEECTIRVNAVDYSCKDFAYFVAAEQSGYISSTKRTQYYEIWREGNGAFRVAMGNSWDPKEAVKTATLMSSFIEVKALDLFSNYDFYNKIITGAERVEEGFVPIIKSISSTVLTMLASGLKEKAADAMKLVVRAAMGTNAYDASKSLNAVAGKLGAQAFLPTEYPFDIKISNDVLSFTGPSLRYGGLQYEIEDLVDYGELSLSQDNYPCHGLMGVSICNNNLFVKDAHLEAQVQEKNILIVANKESYARTRSNAAFFIDHSIDATKSVLKAKRDSVLTFGGWDVPFFEWTFNIEKLASDGNWYDFNPEQNQVPSPSNSEVDGIITLGQIYDELKETDVGTTYFDFFDVLVKEQSSWLGRNEASVLQRHKTRGIFRETFEFNFLDGAEPDQCLSEEAKVSFAPVVVNYFKLAAGNELWDNFPTLHREQYEGNDYLCITNQSGTGTFPIPALPVTVLAYEKDVQSYEDVEQYELDLGEQKCFLNDTYGDREFAIYDSIFSQYVRHRDDFGSDAEAMTHWNSRKSFLQYLGASAHDYVADEHNFAFLIRRDAQHFNDVGEMYRPVVTGTYINELSAEETTTDFTITASDARGLALSVEIVGQPTYGSVTVNGMTATYTLEASMFGSDTFKFLVRNSEGYISSVKTATVEVLPSGDIPEITGEYTFSGTADQFPHTFEITATDPNGSTLTAEIAEQSTFGTAVVDGMQVTYNPGSDFTCNSQEYCNATPGLIWDADANVCKEDMECVICQIFGECPVRCPFTEEECTLSGGEWSAESGCTKQEPCKTDSFGIAVKNDSGVTSDTQMVTVSLLTGGSDDRDGDGVADAIDLWPDDVRFTIDSDADGMADEWESSFASSRYAMEADEDTDGDGYTNLVEFEKTVELGMAYEGYNPNKAAPIAPIIQAMLLPGEAQAVSVITDAEKSRWNSLSVDALESAQACTGLIDNNEMISISLKIGGDGVDYGRVSYVVVADTGEQSFPGFIQCSQAERSIELVSEGFDEYFGVEELDMSSDGCWVAFSTQDDLPGVDENNSTDLYVRDMCTPGSAPKLVSVGMDEAGNEVPGGILSYIAKDDFSISATGQYVAFAAGSKVLRFTGHEPGVGIGWQIFVRDIVNEQTYLVSSKPNGDPMGGSGDSPQISADGRVVAFYSSAYELDPDFPVRSANIYAYLFPDHSYANPKRTLVGLGRNTSGELVASGGYNPRISGNGRYVTYWTDSEAPLRLTGHEPSCSCRQLFLRDLESMSLELISEAVDGGTARHYGYFDSDINYDGSVVTFASSGSNITSIGNEGGIQIYARDRTNKQTFLLTKNDSGLPANGDSTIESPEYDLSLRGNGLSNLSFAFSSKANNLKPIVENHANMITTSNVFNAYAQVLGNLGDNVGTELISRARDVNGDWVTDTSSATQTVISEGGTVVAFGTHSDIYTPETHKGWQVYRSQRKSQVNDLSGYMGTWQGDTSEGKYWTIDLNLNRLVMGVQAGVISYPSLQCEGTLKLIGVNASEVTFHQDITAGSCVDDLLVYLRLVDDSTLLYREVDGEGVLTGGGSISKVNN